MGEPQQLLQVVGPQLATTSHHRPRWASSSSVSSLALSEFHRERLNCKRSSSSCHNHLTPVLAGRCMIPGKKRIEHEERTKIRNTTYTRSIVLFIIK